MTDRPDDTICGNCVFVDLSNMREPFCRRFPPQLVTLKVPAGSVGDVGVRRFWPIINPVVDWCGEFSARQAAGRKPS